MVIDEETVIATWLWVRALSALVLFGPTLWFLHLSQREGDLIFLVALWVPIFLLPFLWAFRSIKVFPEGFSHTPFLLWPRTKVRWSEVGKVSWLGDTDGQSVVEVHWVEGTKSMKIPTTFYGSKGLARFIQAVKRNAPQSEVDTFLEEIAAK